MFSCSLASKTCLICSRRPKLLPASPRKVKPFEVEPLKQYSWESYGFLFLYCWTRCPINCHEIVLLHSKILLLFVLLHEFLFALAFVLCRMVIWLHSIEQHDGPHIIHFSYRIIIKLDIKFYLSYNEFFLLAKSM